MELAIFNTPKSKFGSTEEIKVLWTSVLIAERIYFHGRNANISVLWDLYNLMEPEEVKVEMTTMLFSMMYAKSNLDVSKYSDSFKVFYDSLVKLRKKKGKTKNQMLTLLGSERHLKEIYKNVLNYIHDYQCNLKLEHLTPFIGFSDNHFIRSYHEFSLSFKTDSEKYLKDVRDIFIEPYKFFISDDSVEQFGFEDRDSSPLFLAMDVIDIPDFDSLTSIQFLSFRKSFILAHLDFSAFLYTVKSAINTTDFSKDNLFKEFKVMEKFVDKYKDSYQSKMNDDIKEFTDISTGSKTNKLLIGITSIENLINIYNKAHLFGDEFSLYLKEYLANEIDLKSLMPFFYLKLGS